MFNFFGNFTYDAGAAFGMAQYLSACVNLMSSNGTELPLSAQVAISIVVLLMWSAKNMLSLSNQGMLANCIAGVMVVSNVFIPLVLILNSSSLSSNDFVFG